MSDNKIFLGLNCFAQHSILLMTACIFQQNHPFLQKRYSGEQHFRRRCRQTSQSPFCYENSKEPKSIPANTNIHKWFGTLHLSYSQLPQKSTLEIGKNSQPRISHIHPHVSCKVAREKDMVNCPGLSQIIWHCLSSPVLVQVQKPQTAYDVALAKDFFF